MLIPAAHHLSRDYLSQRVDGAIGAALSACGAASVGGLALLVLVVGGEELILLLLACLSGVGLLEELLTSFPSGLVIRTGFIIVYVMI